MSIHQKKRKFKPEVSENQEQVQKQRLKKLCNETFAAKNYVVCLMDDESYFTLDGNEWQGKFFYDDSTTPVENSVKYITKTKFPKKVMVWVTISQFGLSKAEFFRSGLGVTAEVYKTGCLPKVSDFIREKHHGKNITFWPDLASESEPSKCAADQTN